MTTRVAVVGAGPSGFYVAEALLQANLEVDVFDVLPTPFGLVRAGVAPDHPKIKTVTRVYERTAAHPGFRFFGGVELGRDIEREELRKRYTAVVYAVGASIDRRLGIPGEDLHGSHSATEFVAWYNGHPRYAQREFRLDVERAVVVGNGNVALDVARMLLLAPAELAVTDTADHALSTLTNSAVREVVVLGRRGPAQASFTTPELKELADLSRADVMVEAGAAELDPGDAGSLGVGRVTSPAERNLQLLRGYAAREAQGRSHRLRLCFLRSPLAILGDPTGRVTGLRVGVNRLDNRDGVVYAVPTGEEEIIPCGLVLRSVGYRGARVEGVPFDRERGLIANERGRVVDEGGAQVVGEYAVGWIKRGPNGVIGTNKRCAGETATSLLEDLMGGVLSDYTSTDRDEIATWLERRVDHVFTWADWGAVDRREVQRGKPSGRPRVKVVQVPEMLAIARDGERQ